MGTPIRQVISASRRTDIPAFYMAWFMRQIREKRFKIINPYNRRLSIFPATPDRIHTIVFWSKNFAPFLALDCGRQLQREGYNLFFNFTINSEDHLLEPHVPPLDVRLRQLARLCQHFGPECINWRFDPICFYHTDDHSLNDNLHDFDIIAEHASKLGIQRCITSFRDDYAKIRKRIAARSDFSFIDPSTTDKRSLILNMEKRLTDLSLKLELCCEKKFLALLPQTSKVTGSACIPVQLLEELFGGHLSMQKDSGQRIADGCGCGRSKDIGSYHLHPCYHNCLFCYANPSSPPPKEMK